jgi:uncharacterized protein YydD (DUF2326 family)
MIHGVTANKESFRKVTFLPGLNLVLADRSQVASKKDTTNALGKSTLVEIIDFLPRQWREKGHRPLRRATEGMGVYARSDRCTV